MVALVRKDAPNDLLIGTDAQPRLGFSLLVRGTDGRATNLFSGRQVSPDDMLQDPPETPVGVAALDPPTERSLSSCDNQLVMDPSHQYNPQREASPTQTVAITAVDTSGGDSPDMNPEVRLLQAVRIPAHHRKLVRASVGSGTRSGPLLLLPGELGETVQIADGVVEVSDDRFVTLSMENHGTERVCLKKGTHLGTVTPVDVVAVVGERGETGDDGPGEPTTDGDTASGEERGGEPSERGTVETHERMDGGEVHPEPTKVHSPSPATSFNGKCGSARDSARVQLLEEDHTPDTRTADLFSRINWDLSHHTEEELKSLKSLLVSYSDVFALNPNELGTTQLVTHSIDTGSHPPIKQPIRRTPFALRKKIDQLVQDMLDQGVVEASQSPWASPIVLVQKKDGGVRFCVDYRKLNRTTKLDEFPLPRIDDILDQLRGSRHFSTLDLASGYWQIAMDSQSKEKTAFTTYSGLFQFRKMPFGLVNAPATFQRLMEVVLAGLARKVCVVYLDDILVFGRTLAEHNANLTLVLERLRTAGLRLKPKKCCFALKEVEYLGHVVSANGVQTDPKKLRAVEQFPPPHDLKTLRSFLGLASYYRKFVPNFATVARPLHALTKKDVPFLWSSECQDALTKLKKLLTSAPVLAYPDFAKPFVLETDASGEGLGAVLAQQQEDNSIRPIAYASRSLQSHEKNYGSTELEGLGVVWAVKHFRPYLYGHKCEVFTDHSALTSLLNTPQPSGKLARWGMAIQELDLHIRHRSGKSNANADGLSRCPLPPNCEQAASETDGVIATIETEADLAACQRQDKELAPVICYLETGLLPDDERLARTITLSASQYVLEDDVLYRLEQDSTLRIIPPTDQREKLFQEAHSGVFGAHLSDVKVHSELRCHYWWSGMRRDITGWTRGCITCNSHSTGRAMRPPLTPIPVGGPFDRIGVDVIQFPRSRLGNQYAVVFVDYLTKWPEVYPVPDQTAATIANLLVREIMSRHGVPSEVLSDRGRAFLSSLMKEVQQLLGFRKTNTTAYHPQTDGLVERFNRTLTSMLAKTVE